MIVTGLRIATQLMGFKHFLAPIGRREPQEGGGESVRSHEEAGAHRKDSRSAEMGRGGAQPVLKLHPYMSACPFRTCFGGLFLRCHAALGRMEG